METQLKIKDICDFKQNHQEGSSGTYAPGHFPMGLGAKGPYEVGPAVSLPDLIPKPTIFSSLCLPGGLVFPCPRYSESCQ